MNIIKDKMKFIIKLIKTIIFNFCIFLINLTVTLTGWIWLFLILLNKYKTVLIGININKCKILIRSIHIYLVY